MIQSKAAWAFQFATAAAIMGATLTLAIQQRNIPVIIYSSFGLIVSLIAAAFNV